jgi:hypothetical protein
MFLRVNRLLCITFILFTGAAVNAAPTVKQAEPFLMASVFAVDAPDTTACGVETFIEPADAQLAYIGRQLLQPPDQEALHAFSADVKALPGVPPAIFVLLVGFLCVSLVRDRRVWFAAFAAVLWASQAGLQAIPKLALRLTHRIHSARQVYTSLTCTSYLENSVRPRCDIDGTQYIGLLHHLAGIPDTTISSLRNHSSSLRKQGPTQIEDEFRPPQSAAIAPSYRLITPTICPADVGRQFISFSPAFIFPRLARGPPEPA